MGNEHEQSIRPYGTWASPISAQRVATAGVALGRALADGDDLYWLEGRPAEGGRNVLVRRTPDGTVADVTPQGFNARTRVHEYGGGDYLVDGGIVYFSNFADQRLYRQDVRPSGDPTPRPITPEAALRFADPTMDRARSRLICVREDKRLIESDEDVNTLVAVDLSSPEGDAQGGTVLVGGHDFFSSPRLSPDGARLAWLAWDFPHMPWDAAALYIADVRPDGTLGTPTHVAGGPEGSAQQPVWGADGTLYFVAEPGGWWNIQRWRDGRAEPVLAGGVMQAEFGVPLWQFGVATFAVAGPDHLVCAYVQDGTWHLGSIALADRTLTPLETPYTVVANVLALPGGRVVFRGASPTRPVALVERDLTTGATREVKRSVETGVDSGYLSIPEAITFPTAGGASAHAFYYPPANRDYAAPEGELPPLMVLSHGGPTSAVTNALSLTIQFWTSRGIGVVDVNYGGSTGYGRAYRERLRERWGIVDVDDCVNAARYLVERGDADPKRLLIAGGSAGGFTTLVALTRADTASVFAAGASYYGIGDVERMAEDARDGNPHKFESRYDVPMIAPWPEGREVYRQRSAINYADSLSVPVIFFQGLDDVVVLPNQAERMVEVLRRKGLPVAYIAYAGEGHGFRRAETIINSLESELYFYGRVLGFTPADAIAPVEIENLPDAPATA